MPAGFAEFAFHDTVKVVLVSPQRIKAKPRRV